VHAERAALGDDPLEGRPRLGPPGLRLVRLAERPEPVEEQQEPRLVGPTGERAVLGDGAGARGAEAGGALVDLDQPTA